MYFQNKLNPFQEDLNRVLQAFASRIGTIGASTYTMPQDNSYLNFLTTYDKMSDFHINEAQYEPSTDHASLSNSPPMVDYCDVQDAFTRRLQTKTVFKIVRDTKKTLSLENWPPCEDLSVFLDDDSKQLFDRDMAKSEYEAQSSHISPMSKKITKQKPIEPKPMLNSKTPKYNEQGRGRRSPWQAPEDAKLLELVQVYGQKWAQIASIMGGRTGKQVRDRYLNVLRPDRKKGSWSNEEDEHLLSLYKTLGHKWSQIASHMPGRTEVQVKNRFYTCLKKTMGNDETSPQNIDAKSETSGSKSPSGSNSNSYRGFDMPEMPSSQTSIGNEWEQTKLCIHIQRQLSQNCDIYSTSDDSQSIQERCWTLQSISNGNIPVFENNYLQNNSLPIIPDPTDVISFNDSDDRYPKISYLDRYFAENPLH